MTKQLFAQLDDLAAEQVVGGKQPGSTFYTPQVNWVDTNMDTYVSSDELSWTGYYSKQQTSSGKFNNTDGVSNNRYSSNDSNLASITYWYTDLSGTQQSTSLVNPLISA